MHHFIHNAIQCFKFTKKLVLSLQKVVEVEASNVVEGHFTPHPSDVLDMPVDPNEPTYCLCHQVSYGEMIGCDNNDCPIGELILVKFSSFLTRIILLNIFLHHRGEFYKLLCRKK